MPASTDDPLVLRVRTYLSRIVGQATPITYQALAAALELSPPNTIRQLTLALEYLMEEDVVATRPMIASLVVSKTRGGLPAPGFFDCARRIGRLGRNASAQEQAAYHAAEFDAAVKFWGATAEAADIQSIGIENDSST